MDISELPLIYKYFTLIEELKKNPNINKEDLDYLYIKITNFNDKIKNDNDFKEIKNLFKKLNICMNDDNFSIKFEKLNIAARL